MPSFFWSQLNEGIETIRHSRSYPDYFNETLPVSEHGLQYFHGLGGEVIRGFYYYQVENYLEIQKNEHDFSAARKIIMRRWPKEIKLSKESESRLDSMFTKLDVEINALNGNCFHWLDCFYWLNRTMHWGEDLVSTKNPMFWLWTPLLDRDLVSLIFKLSADEKRKSEFIENLTNELAPSLSAIRYGSKIEAAVANQPHPSRYLLRRLKGNFKKFAKPIRDQLKYQSTFNEKPETIFWKGLLLQDELLTNDFISKKSLRLLSRNNPNSDILWNVMTVELFSRALIR